MLNSSNMPTGLYIVRDRESGQLSAAYLEENRSYHPWQIVASDEIYDDRQLDQNFEVICQVVDGQKPESGLYMVHSPMIGIGNFPLVTDYALAEYFPAVDQDKARWEMTDDETMSWWYDDQQMAEHHMTPVLGFNFKVKGE